ncbi:dephospho-CoA kinase [Spongiibacter sp. KMU-158]|uniref:Dephospho-CoA kinase n=1 Tax=Spongiibacter pelagi TaxID=2760804 RepID=A0A927C547_9GAMM|nr:dephospho-CoA kinase [Spongiibacter pelagi]MBD2859751.1 dephospho-CoA kinase [Spongiibacter pelagi]
MSKMIIGLTGGIGSGKTAVSDRFAAHGISIVDADVISRVVVEPGRPALEKIRDHFGTDILLEDGNLDRAQLRQKIFSSPTDKQWLESLLHPLIAEETLRQLSEAQSPYAIYVSPLLVESNQKGFCQRLLVVDVSEETQLQRTIARDSNDAEQVKRIIASQASREQRLALADDIIVNDSDLKSLHEKVDAMHQSYLALV